IHPRLDTGSNDTGEEARDGGTMLGGIEQGVLALANTQFERPVKLSEGIAPSAGLQNRACQLPGTRLLKRVGSCHKYAPDTIDRAGPRVSGRDSDGGPPPDCVWSSLRAADCGDAPPETSLAGRRGHNSYSAHVGALTG